VNKTYGDGPRTWSRLDATNAFARTFASIGHTRMELQGTSYDATRAENTGALTAAELSRDPTLPDSLNITKHSRKAAQQQQGALIVSHGNDDRSVSASLFAGTRTLDNPLPFAIVAVDRALSGGSLRATLRTTRTPWPMRFTAGADGQRQDDSRLNYENCADVTTGSPTARCPVIGNERGAIRLDQREEVRGIGAYARAEVEAPHGVFVSAAVRHDEVDFTVTDRFITSTNADDSGERTMGATTPMFGIAWRAKPRLSLFANLSQAFETPTITELTNKADGSAGLNQDVVPQRTNTFETGVHALVGYRLSLELAGFHAIVHDELVPFDVPARQDAVRFATQARLPALDSSRACWRCCRMSTQVRRTHTHISASTSTQSVQSTTLASRFPVFPSSWRNSGPPRGRADFSPRSRPRWRRR
jgi:iron complex outermembrane receptor protein